MGTVGQFHHGLPLGTHGTPGPEVVGISVNIHHPAILDLNLGGATNLTELAAAVHFTIHILCREGYGRQACFSVKGGGQYSPAHGRGAYLQEITTVYLWDLHFFSIQTDLLDNYKKTQSSMCSRGLRRYCYEGNSPFTVF